MSTPGIKGVATYLPERIRTNDELVEELGFDRDFIQEKLGIHQRHVAAEDESCSDVAVQAIEALISNHPSLRAEDIDLLILCTQNPDYKLPHTSAIVQDRVGLSNTTACFDINLGCSGFVYSLAVAKSMMESVGMKNALIVTADLYSKVMHPSDRSTIPLFGDAGCAVWLGTDAGNSIGAFTFGTDGAGYENLIVRKGGARERISGADPDDHGRCLFMNGRAIFEFMLTRIPSDIERCLTLNEKKIDDVDYFLFHQASAYMLNYLGKRMKLPPEKLPVLLRETGNTVSSTIPMALEWLIREGKAAESTVLLSGFGVGLSWASTVLEFE